MTTGLENTLIGVNAGDALTDADFNVAIGTNAAIYRYFRQSNCSYW
jgi:hypothetical protein